MYILGRQTVHIHALGLVPVQALARMYLYGSFRSAVLAFEAQIRTAHGGEKIRCWADVKYSPGPVLIESPQCQLALVMLHEYLSSKDLQIELLS